MLRSFLRICCLLVLGSGGAVAQAPATAERYPLIPYPASLTAAPGSFTLTPATTLALPPGSARFAQEAAQLQALLTKALGAPLKKNSAAAASSIVLRYDATLTAPEGYRLTITPQQVTLAAKEPVGMFRAVQTMRQLLPPSIERAGQKVSSIALPAVQIQDQPAFSWRGMHLDVARHFFSVAFIKKYIDLLALYKFNKLHLHLTDDQGWRLEIKKYPKLTDESAWRPFNNHDSVCIARAQQNPDFALDPQHLRQRNGRTEHGGFYTQAQMRDLIAFAAARHVEIVPEIDMPGHMLAAIKADPSLTCDSKPRWGKTFSTPLCPCNENTYQFVENVLAEVAALFPSRYVHIGADEVETVNWSQAQACSQLMQREGSKRIEDLQGYFVRRVERFLQRKGKKIIGWDEVLDHGIDSAATVMYWRGWVPKAPAKAVENGNTVVMTPSGTLYFDYAPDKSSLEKVYRLQVVPAGIAPPAARRILGAQANLWTEYIASESRADYMLMPRLTALAEAVWTHKDEYAAYLRRLDAHYPRLALLNVGYRVPDLQGFAEENVFITSSSLTVARPPADFTVRYTTDGSAPTATSPVLAAPLPIAQSTTVKLAAFTPEGRRGDVQTARFQQQQYASPVVVGSLAPGLQATYFTGLFKTAARMQDATAKGSAVANTIAVPPAAQANQFGVQFRGYLEVPETAIYTFYLTCDDGGTLRVANRLVVDNDGLHPPQEKSGQVALGKGLHPLALDFVEGGGGYTLRLQYSLNGGPQQDVPAAWLKH